MKLFNGVEVVVVKMPIEESVRLRVAMAAPGSVLAGR